MFDKRRRLSDYVVGSFVGSLSPDEAQRQRDSSENADQPANSSATTAPQATSQNKEPKPKAN